MSRILFVINEDWFFRSHFLAAARLLREDGFTIGVATRLARHRAELEGEEFALFDLTLGRKGLNPVALWRSADPLRGVVDAWRPDIVHAIGLRPILVAGLALKGGAARPRVVAVTGLGYLGADRRLSRRALRALLRHGVRWLHAGHATRYVFENEEDPRLLGLDGDGRVLIVGGAGIDPEREPEQPWPEEGDALKAAFVGRMVWSKGVDTAVEGVRAARERGLNVTFDLYGAPDPDNPRAIAEQTLAAWQAEPGIEWHGRTEDAGAAWRGAHVAILPSRGGEGLPRALLEAAAAGRPVITTEVQGCRHFVRDGVEGYLVPVGDAAAIAGRLAELAADRAALRAMGARARARVMDGHTVRHVADGFARAYRDLLRDHRS